MIFFFQAEDGIRDCLLSRGLGDVYKRQVLLETLDRTPDAAELRERLKKLPRDALTPSAP